jgi:SAM-dependent methyltransferase
MPPFEWSKAQEGEIEWWKQHSERTPTWGAGGICRYPAYMEAFGGHFSRESILDVGSGAFPLVMWIKGCRRRISLDPLNSRFAAEGFARDPEVEYLDGVAEKLPFPDRSVDQVLLLNMLDHLADWRTAVDEAIRVAKHSVIVHVHIETVFAGDGLHVALKEADLVNHLERVHGGERWNFSYPKEFRPFWWRCASLGKRLISGRGAGFRIRPEACWAGVLRSGK